MYLRLFFRLPIFFHQNCSFLMFRLWNENIFFCRVLHSWLEKVGKPPTCGHFVWLARVLPLSDEGQVKFANFSHFFYIFLDFSQCFLSDLWSLHLIGKSPPWWGASEICQLFQFQISNSWIFFAGAFPKSLKMQENFKQVEQETTTDSAVKQRRVFCTSAILVHCAWYSGTPCTVQYLVQCNIPYSATPVTVAL